MPRFHTKPVTDVQKELHRLRKQVMELRTSRDYYKRKFEDSRGTQLCLVLVDGLIQELRSERREPAHEKQLVDRIDRLLQAIKPSIKGQTKKSEREV